MFVEKMKSIVESFFALTLFVIQSITSTCDLYNGVANCSSTNLHQVPIVNNTKLVEVRETDYFTSGILRLGNNF